MAIETLVYFSLHDPIEPWRDTLAADLPDVVVRRPEELTPEDKVRYALVWKPPVGFFEAYPDLKLVTILGAGADALAGRTDLPDVPIARLSDPNMGRMMASYVLFAVLRYARNIHLMEIAQREKRWGYIHPREAGETRVGVLGLGELGGYAAHELVRQGFDVRGWSRSPKQIEGVACVSGIEALDPFLAELDIAVVMLPLTPDTRGILDARRLALLPKGAKLINAARGPLIDEEAMTELLANDHLGGATLDVFAKEPLSPESRLWSLPNVLITPHMASVAIPQSAAAQVAENIRRVRRGEEIKSRIDLKRGY